MSFVLLASVVLAIGLFGLNHLLAFLEQQLRGKWLAKNWPAAVGAVMLATALSIFLTF